MNSPLFKVNVSAVVKKDNTFLLVKRSEDETVFPGYWGIPGGTVEATDASLKAALDREFLEEVGVRVSGIEMIANNIVERDEKTMLYIVFRAQHESGTPHPLEDTDAVEWKTYEEAAELKLTPQTLVMLELCL